MSLIPLTALRIRLDSDADLTAWLNQHYGKSASHWLGYKRSGNANDFPMFSYQPTRATRTFTNTDQSRISIVFGVNNPEIDKNIMVGVMRSSEAEDLIVAAFANAIIAPGYKVERNSIDVTYDLGIRHPFYETEFSLIVTQFDQLETGIVPAEVWLGQAPLIGVANVGEYEQVA